MFQINKDFSFIQHRKIFYIISICIIVIGIGTGFIRGFNYGIDFTGGTMFQIDMGKEVEVSELKDVLKDGGINSAEIVHSGQDNKEVIIKTVQALDTAAREVVLQKIYDHYNLTKEAVLAVDQFGPSVGEMLKSNAIKAVLIAGACMLLYIIIRFEWKFGVAGNHGGCTRCIDSAILLRDFQNNGQQSVYRRSINPCRLLHQ